MLSKTRCNREPEVCDAFCNFFSSRVAAIAAKIRSILASGTLPMSVSLEHHTPTRPVGFGDVSNEEAIRAILIVPAKISPMHYISTSILKGAYIRPSNCEARESVVPTKKFPTMFKVGQVTPLKKKHEISADDMSNYRPITILNTIGKCMSIPNCEDDDRDATRFGPLISPFSPLRLES